jgi:hypothetical protein
MSTDCPWCSAPIAPGPKCPRCGANYAKAEAIRLHGRANAQCDAHAEDAEVQTTPESLLIMYNDEPPLVADVVMEWKYCVVALPVMLILAIIFHAFSLGHFFQRTFLSMPVHEFGHAFTAWFCGHYAVPTLWKTLTSDSRGLLTALAVATAVLYMTIRAVIAQDRLIMFAGLGLLLFQVICTLVISAQAAEALIVFGGDGGAMVFGTLLMTTFYFGKDTQLYRGSLRWGFLAIGAAAFVDTFSTWWSALSDEDMIPYGEMEGVGLSDPSHLVETFGWTQSAMVHRYVGLGIFCLLVLVCVWVWGMHKAKAEIQREAQR